MKKGTYGYLDYSKRKTLIKTIAIFCIAFLILLIGYLLNNRSNKNIFTVMAVLFVLPASRSLVGYIVLFPFKTPKKEYYTLIKDNLNKDDILYSDLALSSTEKVMNLSFLLIRNDDIIAYSDKEDKDNTYVKEYLEKLLVTRMIRKKVGIYNDFDKFIKKVKEPQKDNVENDKDNSSKETESLIKTLLI